MTAVQELLDCRISSWYPRFQRVTFRTVILPLPQPVLDWLVSDGLQLPEDTSAFATRGARDVYATEDDYREWTESDGEEEEGGSRSGGSSSPAAQPPPAELAGVQQQLSEAIEELGGRVVPKLSWSVPKDAVWISLTSSLCCTNSDEVLLMLRSSDRVAHDICSALQEAAAADATAAAAAAAAAAESVAVKSIAGSDAGRAAADEGRQAAAGATAAPAAPAVQHCVALRRWYDLQPGREFRCFVRAQQLAGISQRDLTQCFQFLREERAELADAILAFHAKHIQGRFPHPHYTYDVYVATSGAVRLLDFNPVGGTTSPLLFTWQELRLAPGAVAAAEGQAEAAAAEGQVEAAAAEGLVETGAEQLAAELAESAAAGNVGCCGQQVAAQEAQQAADGEASGVPSAAAVSAVPVPAAGPAENPSYREQLRRVQALSLTQQAQQQAPQQQQQAQPAQQAQQQAAQQQQLSPSAAPPPVPASAHLAPSSAASPPLLTSGPAPAQHHHQPPPSSSSSVEFRIIEEAVAMRPSTLAYGVPYDFIDSSEGSALDRLMQQAQQTGAGELWATLAAQGSGSAAN